MTDIKTLKKSHLDDAGAFTDQSSGKASLRDVIEDMAKGAGIALKSFIDGAIATAKVDVGIFPFPVKILDITVVSGDWGDSGQTDIALDSESGVLAEAVTILSSATDDEGIVFPVNKIVEALDKMELSIDTAPTGGADLTIVVTYSPIDVQA